MTDINNLQALTYIIGVLGSFLLITLYLRIRDVNEGLKLNKHRSKDAGMADLLIYAAEVDDGIIIGKNGSFMASWIYQAEDNASSTEEQRGIISAQINKAFSRFGSGWMIHVDSVRKSSPKYSKRNDSHFTDYVCEAIDEERRQLFEKLGTMYEGYFVISVTYYPPSLAQRKFVELMFDDDQEKPDNSKRTHELIDNFNTECVNIESRLSGVFNLQRLNNHIVIDKEGNEVSHDDFLSWIQFCVTGLSHPVILPKNPMYLDALIGGQELWTGTIPKVGRKFIQVVSIEGFPMESYPGILTSLGELSCEYRWSNRFIFMDTHEAINHLEKFRKKWKQKIRGFFDQVFNIHSGNIDEDAQDMTNDAQTAKAEINAGQITQGYYTSVLVLMDENREHLEEQARMIEKAINHIGFTARIETLNTMEAYLGSLPGHGVENIRRPLINSLNLADLIPSSTIWPGNLTNPCDMYPLNSPALMHCITQGATPFRLNLHVSDVGHTLVIGPTGNGKSTLLSTIAAQFRRYPNMSIFAFDKGNSLYALTAGIKAATKGKSGQHFSIAADDDRLAFCPLQYLETKGDRAWAMDWIDIILGLNGLKTTPKQRNEIGIALISMHKSGSKSLSDFTVTIQDESIREAIQQYTVDGSMGHLLDAEKDGLSLSDFTVFEIEELMDMDDKYALPVLLYLFRRIEQSLNGQPAAIILDEAWLMFANDVFRGRIIEWLRVLRKANCLVLMATQSLEDAAKSGILNIILESTSTKIFLPNPDILASKESISLYQSMGLNKRQMQILAAATPKKHYYYASESGRRLFELALMPMTLAFCGASGKENVTKIKKLEAEYKDEWINHWLSSRGIDLSNYGVSA